MTELEKRISKYLISKGIKPHLQGFEYLKTAIKMVYEDKTIINNIKSLYVDGAKIHNTTPQRFERSLRHARPDKTVCNSEYIANVVEKLRYEEE